MLDDPCELGLLPPWHLLGGPGVRWGRREPLIRVTISPATVQAIIEAGRLMREDSEDRPGGSK